MTSGGMRLLSTLVAPPCPLPGTAGSTRPCTVTVDAPGDELTQNRTRPRPTRQTVSPHVEGGGNLLNGAVQRSSAVPTSVLLVDAGLGKISALTEASDESPGSWTLLRAPSLRSALDVLSARSFDCVLVDLDLPAADAEDTWEQLRSHAPDAALLALAAHHDLDHPGLLLADDVLLHTDLGSPNARRAVLRTLRHFRLAGELRR